MQKNVGKKYMQEGIKEKEVKTSKEIKTKRESERDIEID